MITASKSILVKAFNQIFQEKYFLDETRHLVNETNEHIKELKDLTDQETNLPPSAMDLVQTIQNDTQEMIDELEKPLEELCDYANRTDTAVDNNILEGLDLVHQQLRKLIDTIQDDLLSYMIPYENAMIMNEDLEDRIRWYLHLVGVILLVLVIVFGFIPIITFVFIILCRLNCGPRIDRWTRNRLVHSTV